MITPRAVSARCGRDGVTSSSAPVFDLERCDLGEVFDVVGDQRRTFGDGGGGDQHVHVAEGSPESFEFDAQLGVGACRFLVPRNDRHEIAQRLHFLGQRPVVAFFRTVLQLRGGDAGDRAALVELREFYRYGGMVAAYQVAIFHAD